MPFSIFDIIEPIIQNTLMTSEDNLEAIRRELLIFLPQIGEQVLALQYEPARWKEDGTPVTKADLLSEKLITD